MLAKRVPGDPKYLPSQAVIDPEGICTYVNNLVNAV